jgi:hypothetical protein
MKNRILQWMSVLLMGIAVFGVTACGGDDSNDDGGSTISAGSLVGWAFEKTEQYASTGNVETAHWYIEFKTTNFVMVHMWGNGYDEDGSYRWDHGEVDCMFTVSGNKVLITYKNDIGEQEIVLTFRGTVPEGWTVAETGSGASEEGGGGTAGTSDMFGYYSSDSFTKSVANYINDLTSMGNYNEKSWESIEENLWGYGYQIQNGNTINQMFERVDVNTNGREPKAEKGWTPVVYKTESYSGRAGSKSVTIYVYYYYLAEYEKTWKYVVKGSILELSDGTKMEYSSKKLTQGNSSYTKR